MKKIKLTQQKYAIVDDDDFSRLNKFKWCLHKSLNTDYVIRSIRLKGVIRKTKSILMHRVVLGLSDPKVMVDHINHNGLDNRKSNLRICNSMLNNRNALRRKDNSSGFKGVGWHKGLKKWVARITVGGKKISLGVFSDSKTAGKAYDVATKKLFGDFALPNKLLK